MCTACSQQGVEHQGDVEPMVEGEGGVRLCQEEGGARERGGESRGRGRYRTHLLQNPTERATLQRASGEEIEQDTYDSLSW